MERLAPFLSSQVALANKEEKNQIQMRYPRDICRNVGLTRDKTESRKTL